MMNTAVDLTSGTAIGKYEVLRKLATGGMAEIYLARVRGTAGFEKIVVLKRILPHYAEDPSFVQMFLDEARLAATLQHPNIADVYDVGQMNGSYFFTMEFIHGEDARTVRIAARKRSMPIPRPIALAIVHGTAAALAYAHDKMGPDGPLGLVHRDVSSSNVLISFDGAVKLVDFGIARATTRQHKTQTGTLKGKIPYMSPEQCQNRPLDRRSDIFSLGVVLYELTAGRRPFRGESDFEILDQIINKGAVKPSTFDPDYPPELERIVMKLLERQRDSRYQSCQELVGDLEAFMGSAGAWVSAMTLGKYMRELFSDKVNKWEQALADGSSLGDHVASTITSDSARASMRVTPPSIAVPPEPSISIEVTPGQIPAEMPTAPTRSRAILIAGIGAALTVIGVIAFVTLGGKDSKPSAAPTPSPAEAAATPPPPAVAPTPTPPPSTPTMPETTPTVPATTSATPKTTTKPKTATKTATKPKTVTTTTKPAETKPATTTTKPKDTKWDRNSLSLPK